MGVTSLSPYSSVNQRNREYFLSKTRMRKGTALYFQYHCGVKIVEIHKSRNLRLIQKFRKNWSPKSSGNIFSNMICTSELNWF